MTSEDTFRQDLSWEQARAREPWCEEVCRKFFPYFRSMELVTDLQRQFLGIDRIVKTRRRKEIAIDDKMDSNLPDNIFLEYRTGTQAQSKGWLEKDAHTDYLLYSFVSCGVCYFIPFQQLQTVWFQNKDEWVELYGVEVRRGLRVTKGAAVPIEVLRQSGVGITEIRFERDLEPEEKRR